MFSNEVLFFGGFILVIGIMLLLDLGVFNKKDHVVKFGEAAAWTVAWVALAAAFYFIIKTHGDLVHGMDSYAELEHIKNPGKL
jgi:tellurite resistance protein TerC